MTYVNMSRGDTGRTVSVIKSGKRMHAVLSNRIYENFESEQEMLKMFDMYLNMSRKTKILSLWLNEGRKSIVPCAFISLSSSEGATYFILDILNNG